MNKKFVTVILISTLLVLSNLDLFGQYFQPFSDQEKNQMETYKELASGYEQEGELLNASNILNKMAFMYWQNGYYDDAITAFLKSVDLNKRLNNLDFLKSLYSNLGVIYTDLENLEEAINYFEMSLTVRRSIGNKSEISAGLIDVAYLLQVLRQNEDALKYLEEALQIATDENNSKLILNCYQMLSSNYESVGKNNMSIEYDDKHSAYEAFLREENLTEDFAKKEDKIKAKVIETQAEVRAANLAKELQAIYAKAAQDSLNVQIKSKQDSLLAADKEAKERQKDIDLLNAKSELQSLEIKEREANEARQKTVIYAGVGILLLVVLLAFVMFRSYKNQQSANKKLEEQNIEIGKQRDDIKNKSAELEDALGLITLQAQNITKSINYAQGIQEALLPRIEDLNNYLSDSFILFMPRDIVSGDYYWYRQVDSKANVYQALNVFEKMQMKAKNKAKDEAQALATEMTNGEDKDFIISAVDCTGHGVPGAFMSMIGYNLLDEIVDRGITRADLILDELHAGIRRTLKQDVTENRDGMDMAMCIVRKKDKIVEFAGAKNPVLYIQDGEVFTIKGDKTPIGGLQTEHQRKFSRHEIKVDKPTSFYIFSDGYIDQFGGPDGRKFLIKNFRDLLLAYHDQPMEEQKNILLKAMEEWKGNKFKQIDDILVIGFKIE